MNDLNIKSIEELIKKNNDLEFENFLNKEYKIPPCLIVIKENVGNIFYDFHHHDLYEILYVKEGEILYSIEDKQYELFEGDLLLIPPTALHRLDKIISKKSSRIILTFNHNFINSISTNETNLLKCFNLANKKSSFKLSFRNDSKRILEKYFNRLLDLQFSKNYGDDLTYNIRFMQAMIYINKEMMNMAHEEYLFSFNNKIVSETISYIKHNLANKILISDIAKNLSLSESRLSHVFKEHTNTSILKFIIKKRLVLSKELIRKGEHLNNIYLSCGFQDNTSFYRAFKKEYGITPKTYLTHIKNYIE